MSFPHHNVARAIRKAQDQARVLITDLERQGHAQTRQSSAMLLTLVDLQKRLVAVSPPPPSIARFVPELEGLVRECRGKLAPVKTFLEEALEIARRNPS